jgi:hypothetical protein
MNVRRGRFGIADPVLLLCHQGHSSASRAPKGGVRAALEGLHHSSGEPFNGSTGGDASMWECIFVPCAPLGEYFRSPRLA